MGFRNYIRHFLGAILLPFRPSLPWCFPIRELPFEQKEQQEQKQQQQEEKVAKIILFYGFRSYIRHFFGRNSDAFPSFTAMVFSRIRELPFEQKEQQEQKQQQQQEEKKIAKIILFDWFQKLH